MNQRIRDREFLIWLLCDCWSGLKFSDEPYAIVAREGEEIFLLVYRKSGSYSAHITSLSQPFSFFLSSDLKLMTSHLPTLHHSPTSRCFPTDRLVPFSLQDHRGQADLEWVLPRVSNLIGNSLELLKFAQLYIIRIEITSSLRLSSVLEQTKNYPQQYSTHNDSIVNVSQVNINKGSCVFEYNASSLDTCRKADLVNLLLSANSPVRMSQGRQQSASVD